jgi:hypothetical protein
LPTNKQRRDAARRHLERQLERRQEREQRRRKATLITSVVGTVALIVIIVLAFTVFGSGSTGKKKTAAGAGGGTTSSVATPTASTSPTPTAAPSTSYAPAKGAAVSFDGVTVTGATDLTGVPKVTSKSSAVPPKLVVKDLVVGKGAAATPTSTVSIQYVGVLYKNGTEFDSSWGRGAPASFPLTGVVPGFTQGIGGTSGVAPMKVGGRRIIVIPSALGYGATGSSPGVPPNAPLVFVVDLLKVTAAS